MKRILFLLLTVLMFSCKHEPQVPVTVYRQMISDSTSTMFVYMYSICNPRDNVYYTYTSPKPIEDYTSVQWTTTKSPYIPGMEIENIDSVGQDDLETIVQSADNQSVTSHTEEVGVGRTLSSNPTIDLPEEISQIEEGDKLKVYKISNDTIYLGF